MKRLLLILSLAACAPGCDLLEEGYRAKSTGDPRTSASYEESSSANALLNTSPADCQSRLPISSCTAHMRGDDAPGPVSSPGGPKPAPGEASQEAMQRFWLQQRIDARSLTASENLDAIAAAQERHWERHGAYLLFEDAGATEWERLNLRLPHPAYHHYSARMVEGKLLLEARGNLDTDPFEDLWRGGPANGGGAAQLSSDALDAEMFPQE